LSWRGELRRPRKWTGSNDSEHPRRRSSDRPIPEKYICGHHLAFKHFRPPVACWPLVAESGYRRALPRPRRFACRSRGFRARATAHSGARHALSAWYHCARVFVLSVAALLTPASPLRGSGHAAANVRLKPTWFGARVMAVTQTGMPVDNPGLLRRSSIGPGFAAQAAVVVSKSPQSFHRLLAPRPCCAACRVCRSWRSESKRGFASPCAPCTQPSRVSLE
jgi:hypothetical protein